MRKKLYPVIFLLTNIAEYFLMIRFIGFYIIVFMKQIIFFYYLQAVLC